MPEKEIKVPLPIRVPESYIDRLDELADRMGLDRSEVARRALRNGITDLEKLTTAGSNPVINKLIDFISIVEGDEEERQEIRRVLASLTDHKKKSKKQPRTA